MAKRVNRDPIDTIISNYHYVNAIYRSGSAVKYFRFRALSIFLLSLFSIFRYLGTEIDRF